MATIQIDLEDFQLKNAEKEARENGVSVKEWIQKNVRKMFTKNDSATVKSEREMSDEAKILTEKERKERAEAVDNLDSIIQLPPDFDLKKFVRERAAKKHGFR